MLKMVCQSTPNIEMGIQRGHLIIEYYPPTVSRLAFTTESGTIMEVRWLPKAGRPFTQISSSPAAPRSLTGTGGTRPRLEQA